MPRWLTPKRATQLFSIANIAFLGVDIGLAHMENGFAHRAEWVPILFSAVAALMLVPGARREESRVAVVLDHLAGWAAVLIGVAGMVLHLHSGFFEAQTLHNLVYSAPFVAPLAYVGVGCLVLLCRSPESAGPTFGTWVLVLALGGFVGNFVLSLLDHAQNGFFSPSEWIPVCSAALAVGVLSVELARPKLMPLWFGALVLSVQVAVAGAGLGLHMTADVSAEAASVLDRFVFGAPVFAPMLFADLAVLAAIGLWARLAGGRP